MPCAGLIRMCRRFACWCCWRAHATPPRPMRKVPRQERAAVLIAVAEAITAAGVSDRLLPILLAPMKSTAVKWLARCLALEVTGLLPPPVDIKLAARMRPLLSDRHFSHGS